MNDGKQVTLLHSMKVKILLLVTVMLVIMAASNQIVSTLTVRKNLTNLNQNNMKALARICGENIDKAVMASAASLENLDEVLDGVSIEGMSSSYTYVLSPDKLILYHPDSNMKGQILTDNKELEALLNQMKNGNRLETDVIRYEYKGTGKYASFYMGQNLNFMLVMTVDEKEVFATMNRMIYMSLAGALITLIVCGMIGIFIAGKLMKPINQITVSVTKLADLDFREDSVLAGFVKREDEIGAMARTAKDMQEKLKQVVGGLKEQSRELYASSDAMSSSAEEISRSVEQVEKAVAEIAEGATSQAQDTQTATENIILMGDMIAETNTKVEELRTTAREMYLADEKATESLKDLSAINQQTKEAIQVIYDQISHTSISVAEIKKATAIITDIADETNLLSLNASIEAARAGEAGKGFAVVASQIQQLADQSNASAGQIDATISALISEFEETTQTMEAVKEVIVKQDEDVSSTEETFEDVRNGISKAMEDVQAIAEKTEKLDEARIKVVDIVQNLTAIAEENAASTQETSATVAEVSSIMTDMSDNAEQLHRIANDMDEGVEQFRFE